MSIDVGVIGVGRWGKNHLRSFSEIKEANLVGYFDTRRFEFFDKNYGQCFDSLKELLSSVDAVTIATDNSSHYTITKKCLQAGVNVLVEKPFTIQAHAGLDLLELAKNDGLHLSVGYLYRHNPVINAIRNNLSRFGSIHGVVGRYVHSDKPPRTDCGVIFNFGTHLIDICNYLFHCYPKRVFCKARSYISPTREDIAFISLDYGPFIAHFEVSWIHPFKIRDLWLFCELEKVYSDLFEQTMVSHPINIKSDRVIRQASHKFEIRKNEPLREELRSFLLEIKQGKPNFELVEDAIITTKICQMCLDSSFQSKELRIKFSEREKSLISNIDNLIEVANNEL